MFLLVPAHLGSQGQRGCKTVVVVECQVALY